MVKHLSIVVAMIVIFAGTVLAEDGAKPGGKCPEGMAYISPGEFVMGCSPGDKDCTDDEKPAKKVRITSGFCMDITEVTQGAYEKATGGNPSQYPECGAKCPVEKIAWDDAKAYCEKAGGRLPTEAEWEYAARGGKSTIYYWGDAFDEKKVNFCDKGCNFYLKDKAKDDGHAATAPVASYASNPFGLHDMLGNVWEWVEDRYNKKWYEEMPGSDPVNLNPASKLHVARGGAWNYRADQVRASIRLWLLPKVATGSNGFRCAKDI